MKKIMLAVGHKQFEEALIKKIKDQYVFTGVAPYREAILTEAIKNNPDILVIRENLSGTVNMSDIVYSLREKVPSARIIFISTDRQAGDEFLATLVSYGVYDIIVGTTNIRLDALIELINKPNTFGDISRYAAKVTVDEKGGKKIFETKVIQAPSSPEIAVKQQKPVAVPIPLPIPVKKKEVESVIDEDIPLSFNPSSQRAGELKVPEQAKPATNQRYNNSFYSPDDFLTSTSKPVRVQPAVEFKIEKKSEQSNTETKPNQIDEFDFEIVDEEGRPVNKATDDAVVEKHQADLPALDNQSSSDTQTSVLETVDEIMVVEKDNKQTALMNVQTPEAEVAVIEEVHEDEPEDTECEESDNLLSAPLVAVTDKEKVNEVIKPIIKETPLAKPIESKKEQFTRPVSKPVQETKPVVSEIKSSESSRSTIKRSKWFNPYPISEETKVMLFVRTEEHSENHSSLNVAVKLAKEQYSVLYVVNNSNSSMPYFIDSLVGLGSSLVVKNICENYNMKDFVDSLKHNHYDYVIVDAFIKDNWQDWLVMTTHRFLLFKQNKPWIQNVLKDDTKLAFYSRFFVYVIEEYSEFGVSPKVLMSENRPLGIIKIKDKRENNFYAINAKMPFMLFKKNEDALLAYKDILDFIEGKEDALSE